jgi:hypothetical protein
MRVQALAVAAGAVAVAALGYVPVAVAVGSVAVRAESCIAVEPGRVDLVETQGRPECRGDGDPAGPAGIDGVALAVASSDAVEQQIPLSRLALRHDAGLHSAGPLQRLVG